MCRQCSAWIPCQLLQVGMLRVLFGLEGVEYHACATLTEDRSRISGRGASYAFITGSLSLSLSLWRWQIESSGLVLTIIRASYTG